MPRLSPRNTVQAIQRSPFTDFIDRGRHVMQGALTHATWSERPIEERTHMIEIHGELEAEDGGLLSRRIVDLAREGKRWLVISCPESMRYTPDNPPRRVRPW
jgi:hypothetical protein